ncbi:hypothetical protein A2311_04590 [candidate division WOR-1 bacterium RIFOXYB2_FULL_48_7]|uniref:Cell division protein FtsL n=1 Tax=candidate division WOR-1 bacterium RIFOXYB2_FULL_48_7 TaxID=1802583 RepID=A0A1F4TRZ5_UNCSA|nr:MAG: hypothetical protein A2311_04590 [candidate division WOR-1 bacterium RIFOXYB2_FULL_48_7]
MILVIACVIVVAGTHLYFYNININLKYRITELKMQLADLNNQVRSLGGTAAQVENLAYVEKQAKSNLAMIYPEQMHYIINGKLATSHSQEAR